MPCVIPIPPVKATESEGLKQNPDLELITAHSDELGVEAFLPQLDPNILIGMHKAGLLSDGEIASIKASREAMFQDPNCFILLNWFMVCGTKPTA